MDLKTKINLLTEKYFTDVVAIRRHLHQNPELSFHETQTAQYISDLLDN